MVAYITTPFELCLNSGFAHRSTDHLLLSSSAPILFIVEEDLTRYVYRTHINIEDIL